MNELTNERLKEIEARCEAATLGPWLARIKPETNDFDVYIDASHPRSIAMAERFCERPQEENSVVFTTCYDLTEDAANIEFVAHARQDVPDLLRELRTLREQTRWRDVKDELPPPFIDVLLAIPLYKDGGYFLDDDGKRRIDHYRFAVGDYEAGGFLAESECYDLENVSHWQPLPQEPNSRKQVSE